MRMPRFRLKSLMILVLISALALGLGVQISKLDLKRIEDMKPRLFLLGAFFVMVVAKVILLTSIQFRRIRALRHEGSLPSVSRNESTTHP